MGWYLFDTSAYTHWNDLPEKWLRYRREFEAGRSRLILFEALVFEAAAILARSPGGEGAATTMLESILRSPMAEYRRFEPKDLIQAAFVGGRLKSRKGYPRPPLSLVDRLCLAHASELKARIVTTDPGLRDGARLLKIPVDWIAAF